MATKIDDLRKAYDTLSTLEQKKTFITNLDKWLKKQVSPPKTYQNYKNFISECVRKYNVEISGTNAVEKKPAISSTKKSYKLHGNLTLKKIVTIIIMGILIAVAVVFIIPLLWEIVKTVFYVIGTVIFIVIFFVVVSVGDAIFGDNVSNDDDYKHDTTFSKGIPKRININGTWYEIDRGRTGKLELHEYMKKPEYFANETMTNDVYFVTNTDGNKIGEFDMRYMDCKGSVQGVE